MPVGAQVITELSETLVMIDPKVGTDTSCSMNYCEWILESRAGVMDKEHLHFSFPLHRHFTSRRETKIGGRLDQLVGGLTDIHFAHFTERLHTVRRIHRVAPYIVLEFLHTHDPGDHWSSMDADAHVESKQAMLFSFLFAGAYERLHIQCRVDHVDRGGGLWVRKSASGQLSCSHWTCKKRSRVVKPDSF